MRRLEEWPSSTEFGLQAVCYVAPLFDKNSGAFSAGRTGGRAFGAIAPGYRWRVAHSSFFCVKFRDIVYILSPQILYSFGFRTSPASSDRRSSIAGWKGRVPG